MRCVRAILFALLATAPVDAAATSIFNPVAPLAGQTVSQVQGVSEDGSTAVGRSADVSGGSGPAVRWTEASGPVALDSAAAFGIDANTDGSVIVGNLGGPTPEAFRWTAGGGLVGLGTISGGTLDSQGFGVSGNGSTVVGIAQGPSGQEAFRWTAADGMVGLGDLSGGIFQSGARAVSSDGSVIAGYATDAGGQVIARWTQADGLTPLGSLGGTEAGAWGISPDGSVLVGSSLTASGDRVAFRWSASDGLISLGDLPGGNVEAIAYDASSDGSVIVGLGSTTFNSLGNRAFLWTQDLGMVDLQNLLATEYGVTLPGWQLRAARGVSADGLTISGTAVNPDGLDEGFVVQLPYLPTVPEPSSTLLFAAALGVVVGTGRRASSPRA